MELKCNNCTHLDGMSYCSYVKEYLPNGFAKLHFGGAIGEYHGNVRHAGRCGLGYQVKEKLELETTVNFERETIPLAFTQEKKK